MKKIVILTGSPHNPGASKTLADAFEEGAREASNDIYRFYPGLQGEADTHFLQLDNRNNGGMEVGIPDSDIYEQEVIPKLLPPLSSSLSLLFTILASTPN